MKFAVIKKQIKEFLYSLLPYSLKQNIVKFKCGVNKQAELLRDSHIAIYPPSLDFKKVVNTELDRSIAFLPYCTKPMGNLECPAADSVYNRKNQNCIKLSGGECNISCSLGKMVDVLKKYGYTKDRIFIIDRDSNLFPWLKQKKEEGYKYFFPGVGCYYGVGYALDYIEKELGYTGCIVFLDDYKKGTKKMVYAGVFMIM